MTDNQGSDGLFSLGTVFGGMPLVREVRATDLHLVLLLWFRDGVTNAHKCRFSFMQLGKRCLDIANILVINK